MSFITGPHKGAAQAAEDAPSLDQLPLARKIKFRQLHPAIKEDIWQRCGAGEGRADDHQVKASLLVPAGSHSPCPFSTGAPLAALGRIFAHGSFGRVRPAHVAGQQLAAKELRLAGVPRGPLEEDKPAKTELTAWPQAQAELGLMMAPFTKMRLAGVYLDGHRLFALTQWLPHSLLSLALDSHRLDEQAYGQAQLTLSAMAQVADQLADLHASGHVHPDIKPENILAGAQAPLSWVLGDFGLCEQVPDGHRFAPALIGTADYMSPEMMAQRPYSFPSDVASLGISLGEALSGKSLFGRLGEVAPEQLSVSLQQVAAQQGAWHAQTFAGAPPRPLGYWGRSLQVAYEAARGRDPKLARFIFADMMHPEPSLRPDALAARDWARARLATPPAGAADHNQALLMHLGRQQEATDFAHQFEFLRAIHDGAHAQLTAA